MSIAATLDRQDQSTGLFHPRRLGHANLYVSDYERAQEFYYRVAGFHEVYRQPDNQASFISNGNTYHDFGLTDVRSHYAPKGQKPGLFHLAFEVETEAQLVEDFYRAEAAGEKFPKIRDHDVAHSLYRDDPDGNMMEIYADVIRDWRAVRSGIIIKEKPEWVPGVTNPPSTERNYPIDPEIRVVKDAIFHSTKVTHVAMVAADYEAMYRFYTYVVGLSPLTGGPKAPFAVLTGTCGVGDLTLLRRRPGLEPGFHHVGIMVQDEPDLARSLAALGGAGIKLEREVVHAARRTVCIKDPDGIGLHFYVNRDWTPSALADVDAETAAYLL